MKRFIKAVALLAILLLFNVQQIAAGINYRVPRGQNIKTMPAPGN